MQLHVLADLWGLQAERCPTSEFGLAGLCCMHACNMILHQVYLPLACA